jgi:hypothetical protein
MHRRARPSPQRVAFGRKVAGLVAVALLALLASQPFHARAVPAADEGASVAAGHAGPRGADPAHAGEHDRNHCLQCRAVAQTRLGVRAPAPADALAARGPALALRDAAPERAHAAPARGRAAPRAPPASLPS